MKSWVMRSENLPLFTLLIIFAVFISAVLIFVFTVPNVYDSQPVEIVSQSSSGAVRAVLVDKYFSTSCGSASRPTDVFNNYCMDFEYTIAGVTRKVSYMAQRDEFNSHKIGDSVWIRFK